MKHLKVFLLLLLVAPSASAQTDSTKVQNDSITWNKELEGVTVKAQRQLIKQDIDRVGYDVQADEESKTQTVLDMLRKVPMVTVDGEDNIKVKGNSSFKIYKNGHLDPSLTQNAKEILKSMPASMVKRIEVITDPGAREDAEGVNAILNIVMMDGRSFNGVTGGVNLSYSTTKTPSINGNMTTQFGKAIFSIDAGYNKMTEKSSESIRDTERTYLESGRIRKALTLATFSTQTLVPVTTLIHSTCYQPHSAAISIRSMFKVEDRQPCTMPVSNLSIVITNITGCLATNIIHGMADWTMNIRPNVKAKS